MKDWPVCQLLGCARRKQSMENPFLPTLPCSPAGYFELCLQPMVCYGVCFTVYQKQKGNKRVRVKSPPKAMSLYVGPSSTVLPIVPKSLLNWPCVFGLVCFFPNCLKILFFKKRIKKQKLRALEIKVQCIQWLYSCLLISCVQTPIFKKFCIKFVKPL